MPYLDFMNMTTSKQATKCPFGCESFHDAGSRCTECNDFDLRSAAIRAIGAARAHVVHPPASCTMLSSAVLCLEDAEALLVEGRIGNRSAFVYAGRRALDSLGYTVGVFHEAHKRVALDFGKGQGRFVAKAMS